MKKTIITAMVAMVAAVATADFYVNMAVPFGIYDQGGGALISNPGGQALLELFYVGDNGVVDYAGAGAGTLGDVDLGGSGDDVLLGSFIFTAAGGAFDGYISGAASTITAPYQGTGEIFGRVYQGLGAPGDWYYQGAVQVVPSLDPSGDPPPTPADYFVDGGAAGSLANAGQVIPEPATIGLMGIAGLGMYLARRKARR